MEEEEKEEEKEVVPFSPSSSYGNHLIPSPLFLYISARVFFIAVHYAS